MRNKYGERLIFPADVGSKPTSERIKEHVRKHLAKRGWDCSGWPKPTHEAEEYQKRKRELENEKKSKRSRKLDSND